MYTYKDKNQKIALIGCGYWGTIIAKTLISLKFKNIFIFDSNIKNSKTLKNKFNNLKIENNYTKLLKNKKIKNFFLATPPSKNFKIAKKALLYNKNVFVEKPGVTKLSDLKTLNLISKKNNNKLMFGYVYCFNDHIKYVKNILNKKKTWKNIVS